MLSESNKLDIRAEDRNYHYYRQINKYEVKEAFEKDE